MTQKMKSFLIIAAFILLLVLPVSYALIREYRLKHNEAKAITPSPRPDTKQ